MCLSVCLSICLAPLSLSSTHSPFPLLFLVSTVISSYNRLVILISFTPRSSSCSMVLDYRTVSTVHAILYYNVSTATVQSIYTTVVQHMLLLTSMTCYIIFDVAYSHTHLIYVQALLFPLYLAYLHYPLSSHDHIHSINSFPFHPFFTFYSTLSYPVLSCPILSYHIHLSHDLFLFVSLLLYSTFQDGRFFLQDKRSSNGTMVYLQEPLELPFSHPIRLRMGRSTLSIQVTLYISDMTLSPSPIRHLKMIFPLSLPRR